MNTALAALLVGALVTPIGPTERVSVFVELTETAAVDTSSAAAARSARERTSAQARRVAAAARAEEIAQTSNAVPGVVLNADSSRLASLARMPEVKAVHRTVPKSVRNASAVSLTRTVDAWRSTGRLGEGMRIGVIDTGIDYRHADFGGGAFPTAKVVGGHDFAGDAYDGADPTSLPEPDADPMDCEGHGTHVAGTAAGFGVAADGLTFRGSYASVDLPSLRIGPGTAPLASLYALKVFGCEGSTNLTAQALDWALDPNGDGDFSDHLDVVNLSLGSDFGAPDDPDSLFVRKLVRHGVVVVAAAGNGGDFYDVGGSPGNTPEAISVANTRDAFSMLDGVSVSGTRYPGQYSQNYTAPVSLELPVARLSSNVDGCKPITEPLAGKLVWLEWDDNDTTRACGSGARTNNATAAGAAGVLLPSSKDAFPAGIAGNDKIPAFQFTATATTAVRPALEAGTLRVRMDSALKRSAPTVTPKLTDTITPSSSRGSRNAKPDLAAPGDTIFSAAAGTGADGVSMGGTSMASPHVAGIAALLRQAHPSWSVEEIKAALMNTAGGVVRSGDDNTTGLREAPMRGGAGRVDASSALGTSVLAMAEEGTVGVSFGTVEVGGPLLVGRWIRLVNKGTTPVRLSGAYTPITSVPGVTYQLTSPYVVVPAGGTARAQVVLRVADRSALRKTPDPTVDLAHGRQYLAEASGLVTFTPVSGSPLHVPVHAAPKPVSRLKVVAGKVTGRALDQQGYQSRVTALRLQGRSDQLPSCGGTVHENCAVNATARGADLRYAGATSTASLLAFGVVTWENWSNLGSNTWPVVRFEVGGKKFVTRAVKPTDGNDRVLQDVWLARTETAAGELVDEQPLNGHLGDVDTNLFDSNVVVLPVSRAAIGAGPVTYTVGVGGQYTTPGDPDGLIDVISTPMTFTYDLEVPSLSTVVAAGSAAPPGDLLLFHHNASGDRAQAL
ncbi:S8 family serine peptidase [Lentzea tibetensis]|uniref:S8 family serine peptidase n=1 Tax=Lentzea tibetensis TaxID=2591470 RepID=A0A563ETR5_9PSEU|nr:S8 family serine peptidase [Lentzea tibetensis]TWP51117.1 S8 family serine peptidase [Lentzea tibetensis]